jgi:hypothetical protein
VSIGGILAAPIIAHALVVKALLEGGADVGQVNEVRKGVEMIDGEEPGTQLMMIVVPPPPFMCKRMEGLHLCVPLGTVICLP